MYAVSGHTQNFKNPGMFERIEIAYTDFAKTYDCSKIVYSDSANSIHRISSEHTWKQKNNVFTHYKLRRPWQTYMFYSNFCSSYILTQVKCMRWLRELEVPVFTLATGQLFGSSLAVACAGPLLREEYQYVSS